MEGYEKFDDWRAFTKEVPESLKDFIIYFEVKNNKYNKIIIFRNKNIRNLLINEIKNKNIKSIININTFSKTIENNPDLLNEYTCAYMSSDCTHRFLKGTNILIDTVGWINEICKIMPLQYCS